MKHLLTRLLPALACMGGLLLAQDVNYNFDKSADFAKYRTYKWVEIEGGKHPDQITDRQIVAAIDSQLALKGLTKTENDQADLFVGYQVGVDQEKQVNSYSMGGGGRYGYGGAWGGMGGMSTATTSTINIGQLVLDMYDPATKNIVWRGTATKTIDANAKPDKREKNINKGAAKLLKNYPPKIKE